MKRFVIVGGGISGLSAAYRLKRQAEKSDTPVEIQILDASSRMGGTLLTKNRDGYLLEGGPDCFLSEKPKILEFCRELGIADDLIETLPENRQSFIVRAGLLHPVPKGFYLIAPSDLRPFLSSPLLSWRGKWRVLLESWIPARPKSEESLASFVRRRLGQEALDWLAQPLVAGIYAADPETLSLQATFPDFLEMERIYGSVLLGLKKSARRSGISSASGARYSLFVSFKHGMQTLSDALESNLKECLRPHTEVRSVHRRSATSTWDILLTNGETLSCDGVCLALPADRSAQLLEAENPDLAKRLRSIPYGNSVTLNMAYPESTIAHPLNGFGFVVPQKENRVTLACTFVHRKFPGRAPAGQALLRAFIGGESSRDLFALSDEALVHRVRSDFEALLGIKQEPLFYDVQRWPNTMPQFTLGHLPRVLQMEEMLFGMKGLTLAGNWMRGVGIPDCIESGERAAELLLKTLKFSQKTHCA